MKKAEAICRIHAILSGTNAKNSDFIEVERLINDIQPEIEAIRIGELDHEPKLNFNFPELDSELNEMNRNMMSLHENFIQNLQSAKESILHDKVKELGIEIDLMKEVNRRFKKFQCVHENGKETYYFDDGSEKGKRIVTFEFIHSPMTFDDFTSSVSVKLNYY